VRARFAVNADRASVNETMYSCLLSQLQQAPRPVDIHRVEVRFGEMGFVLGGGEVYNDVLGLQRIAKFLNVIERRLDDCESRNCQLTRSRVLCFVADRPHGSHAEAT
jgi:hypothetical protein